MKYILILITISSFFSQDKATLIVNVIGFENHNGKLLIALTNSESTYLTDKVLDGKRISIHSDTVIVRFENLDPGEYAVQAYHDENEDGELTTNFLGIPTERYAFSNNARGSFGPADYKDSKFTVNQKNIEMTIVLE